MEIKKPTLQAFQTNLLEVANNNEEKASQIASRIEDRNALQKKIGDVIAVARNNDASGINELLEANQTLTDQKTQVHLHQDNFETPKPADRYLSSTNEGSPKVDPSALSLLDQNLLAARFAGPMIKKLS